MHQTYKHFRIDKETGELRPWFTPHKDADGLKCHPGYTPAERGGLTVCFLHKDKDEPPVAYGIAECSLKDTFKYAMGRKIALGRAKAMLRGDTISYEVGKRSPCQDMFKEIESVAKDMGTSFGYALYG
jgi:hypothetical protein